MKPRGFTRQQQPWYRSLLAQAFEVDCERRGLNPNVDCLFDSWKEDQLESVTGHRTSAELNHNDDYDCVMLHLAQIAGDENAIEHFSTNAERTVRWRIARQMESLAKLEGYPVDWGYVRKIADHMHLPEFDDCPALLLRKLVIALDKQIKRLWARNKRFVQAS